MDDRVLDLILQLPNLAVALGALYWCSGVISQMLEHQRQLIDKLLDMSKRNEALVNQINNPHETRGA